MIMIATPVGSASYWYPNGKLLVKLQSSETQRWKQVCNPPQSCHYSNIFCDDPPASSSKRIAKWRLPSYWLGGAAEIRKVSQVSLLLRSSQLSSSYSGGCSNTVVGIIDAPVKYTVAKCNHTMAYIEHHSSVNQPNS
jgi:hypothetical protein